MQVEIARESVEIAPGFSKQKCLGSILVGDIPFCAEAEGGHRLQIACAQFHNQQTCYIEVAT